MLSRWAGLCRVRRLAIELSGSRAGLCADGCRGGVRLFCFVAVRRISGSVAAETRFEARANRSPIGLREPANQADLTLQQRDGKQSEKRRLMKSRLSPVA